MKEKYRKSIWAYNADLPLVTIASIANEERAKRSKGWTKRFIGRKRSVAANIAHGGPGKSRSTPEALTSDGALQ